MEPLKVNIKDLRPNPDNPRSISNEDFERLVLSILTFPRMYNKRKIVVEDPSTLVVLGGNMRDRAFMFILGMSKDEIREKIAFSRKYKKKTDVEIDRAVDHWIKWQKKPEILVEDASDFTPEERREFIIKDNVSNGDWDEDELANKWDTDDLDEWGLDRWQEDKDPKEDKDLSDKVGEAYEIVVSCDGEADQERLFNEFKERGLKCRVLTL